MIPSTFVLPTDLYYEGIISDMHFSRNSSILFRDLKPENVARNHHGAFQLLDFGLAKEMKTEARVSDGLYRLTGLTGTVRVMAPEVLQCQPYGLSADVYSFGVVVWEVFCGKKNSLSASEVAKGQRPALPVMGMPPRVDSVVQKCWSAQWLFRPTFPMLCQEVEYQLLELQQQHHRIQQTDNDLARARDNAQTIFNRSDFLRSLSMQSMATMEESCKILEQSSLKLVE
jgi:serine/threonine protein kinase